MNLNILESENNSLIDMARGVERRRLARGKPIFKDGVNQRASLKQREVCEIISDALPGQCAIYEPELCRKRLVFDGIDYLESIDISYYSKNSLFARVFDLVAESSFPAGEILLPDGEEIDIGVSFTGGLKIKSAVFKARLAGRIAAETAERLNAVSLLNDKLLALEAVDFRISLERASGNWTIGMATGKGSTVWSLFPPMLMLVDFSKSDAMRLIELFKIAALEIKRFERRHSAASAGSVSGDPCQKAGDWTRRSTS
jgi:hypothetical protein